MTQLTRQPIYRSLTRPQMLAGVTMNYFIINMTVSTIAFLVLDSFWFIPVPIIMHIIGYFACLREPRVFDLWITKVSKCPRVPNYRRWGCNSYAP